MVKSCDKATEMSLNSMSAKVTHDGVDIPYEAIFEPHAMQVW